MSYLIRLTAVSVVAALSSLTAAAGAQDAGDADRLAELLQQNRQLAERLNFLEARREAFRWARFAEGSLLRTGTVLSISPLPDGRLAFATDEQGLVIYDGSRFEVLDSTDSPLADNFVTEVAAADSNLLYIGTDQGLFTYEKGIVRKVENLPAELESATVSCLASGGDGRLWVGTQGMGLWLLESAQWRNWRTGEDTTGLADDDINDIALAPGTGQVWVATAGGGVSRLDGGVWTTFRQPLGEGSQEVYSIIADPDGLVWIGTVAAGAGFWDGASWLKAPQPVEEGTGVVHVSLIDGGDLFFGTTAGAYLYERNENRWERLPVPEELAPYPIVSSAEFHNHLWLSPAGQGLYLFDRGLIRRYSAANGLPSDNVYNIAQSADGRIWCSTWNGIGIYDGRRWHRLGRDQGLPDDLVTFVLFEPEGKTFFGTHHGLAVLDGGSWRVYDRDSGMLSNTVNHLALGPDGRLWISTEGGGLACLKGDSLWVYTRENGLPVNQVQAAAPAPDGTLWIATKAGLAVMRNGSIAAIAGLEEGAPPAAHFTCLFTAPDGTLWAGTNGLGLWRRSPDGVWTGFSAEDGLAANQVLAISRLTDGRMLFGTQMGLTAFDGQHWRSYGTSDGFNPGAVRYIFTDRDGSVWLAGVEQGVVRFEPGRLAEPETFIACPDSTLRSVSPENHPVVMLPGWAADSTPKAGKLFYFGNSFYRELADFARTDTLTVDRFTVEATAVMPWWIVPPAAFRYAWRLDNGPWSGFNYGGTLPLFDLGRGPHLLQVRAKGPHLRVDSTPATYRFYVDLPTFWSDWRTWAVASALLLAALVILRRRQLAWWVRRIRYRHFRPITPNPFHPNSPLAADEQIIGRKDILDSIGGVLSGAEKGSVVLHGGEKIGLTSFLRQCAELAGKAGVKVVRLDLAREYFTDIASLADRITALLADGQEEEGRTEGGSPFERLVEAIHRSDSPVLLLFDDAELAARLVGREGERGEKLLATFRELVLDEKGASFIFAPAGLEAFREQAGVLFDMSRIFKLGPVALEESTAILTQPLEGRAFLHDEASALLVRLAGGHPYLLHYLGQELVEEINQAQTNFVTLEMASRTVDRLIGNPPVYLLDLWDELTRREKLLLAAAYSTDGGAELGLQDIAFILATHRIDIVPEELAKASADLARRGLLETGGEGRITARDSLLGRWIKAGPSIAGIYAAEDYDIGEELHRLADELSHSFRLDELVERVVKFLEDVLHCQWDALYALTTYKTEDNEVPADLLAFSGRAKEDGSLPVRIPGSLLDSLIRRGEAVVPWESAQESRPAAAVFEPGTLVLALLARGVPVGLLALGPRRDGERYSRRDRTFCRTCAEQAAVALENVRMYQEETEKERLRQELDTARRMQMAILPERKPEVPGLDCFAHLNPATEVGGDYFDYRLLDSGEFIFLIADVSGHGVSAGTLVSMSKSCVFNQVRFNYGVAEMMTALNEMVRGTLAERLLMTLCYTIFDTRTSTLTYSVAGHPFPYHYCAADGVLSELELVAYPLGVTGKARYKVESRKFGQGDVFVFYSDGIIEAANPEGEQFGFERFEQAIRDNRGLDAESVAGNILESFDRFREGVPQADDVTLVVIRIK